MIIHGIWNLTLPRMCMFCLYVSHIFSSVKLGVLPSVRCLIPPDLSYGLGFIFKMLFLENKIKHMSHLHNYKSRHLKNMHL